MNINTKEVLKAAETLFVETVKAGHCLASTTPRSKFENGIRTFVKEYGACHYYEDMNLIPVDFEKAVLDFLWAVGLSFDADGGPLEVEAREWLKNPSNPLRKNIPLPPPQPPTRRRLNL